MFNGFFPQTHEFLLSLAFNNERSWFTAHKEEFEKYVKEPFGEFGRELLGRVEDAYPEKQWRLRVTRIYRDARRLFGRGPYKDHLWLTVSEDGMDDVAAPAFWFAIEPVSYGYGMGIYSPTAAHKERYREMIDANPFELERLAESFGRQDVFTLSGDSYAKKKGSYAEPLSTWYNLKSFSLECRKDYGPDAYSPAIVDEVARGYGELMPYYEYFRKSSLEP